MKYNRILIISKSELSSWKSCQFIVGNLARAYLPFKADTIQVASEFTEYQAYKTAKKIKEVSPDLIIWIDHSPNPTLLIKALVEEYGRGNEIKPQMLIHLFGDFVLDCLAWKQIENELKIWPLHFLTASKRQQSLVKNLFHSSEEIVSCLPFPVDETIFNTHKLNENRHKIRAEYKIKEDEIVFLYTGRLSYQKNVELLLKGFLSVETFVEKKLHLWIAGGMDDILLPYFGKHGLNGSYFSHLQQTLEQIGANVKFLGNCSTEDLIPLYHAADVFVSMSTYNDEDYGMSPAEALCTGLPSLLSDWGGYTSFGDYSDSVKLVPVSFESGRPLPLTAQLRKGMITSALMPQKTPDERKNISDEMHKHVSISAVTKMLQELLPILEFGKVEFSETFLKMCDGFKNNKTAPFKNESNENSLSDLYKEVYSVYGE